MFLKAYCFLDTKTGLHSIPFFVHHEAIAVRSAVDLAQDRSTQISRHPNDFVLVHVGEFDDSIGRLSSCPPRTLGVVSALVAQVSRHAEMLPLFDKESAQ